MPASPATSIAADPVLQFSVFIPNRVGCLSDIIGLLHKNQVHVMAITVIDTTDTAVVRFVVDDPDKTRKVLPAAGYPVSEGEILAVEIATAADVQGVLAALLEAEVNVHYIYSFIRRPEGKAGLVFNSEDPEVAAQALNHRGYRVLTQRDVSR